MASADAAPGELSSEAAEVSGVLCYPFNCRSVKERHEAVRASPARQAPHALTAVRERAAVRRCVELAELPRDAGVPAEPRAGIMRHIFTRLICAQHALDECVEAGERRRFRVDSSCRRWRRIYQSCGLHGDLDCSRQLEWLRDCIRTTLEEEMAKPKVLAAEPPR